MFLENCRGNHIKDYRWERDGTGMEMFRWSVRPGPILTIWREWL